MSSPYLPWPKDADPLEELVRETEKQGLYEHQQAREE